MKSSSTNALLLACVEGQGASYQLVDHSEMWRLDAIGITDTPAGRRYQQSQQRIDVLQTEVSNLKTARDEQRIKVEFQEKEILNLQEKNEALRRTLNEAQTLRDELDVHGYTSKWSNLKALLRLTRRN